MATQIVVPKLGLTTDDATIVEWKAKEGDWVERGAVVAVLETQKVEWNVEAEGAGYLHIILDEGEKAAIGRVIGILAASKEELRNWRVRSPQSDVRRARGDISASRSVADDPGRSGDRVRITPVARKMAEEKIIDITRIKGTGPGGGLPSTMSRGPRRSGRAAAGPGAGGRPC